MRIGIVTTWFERGAAYVSRQYRDILQQHYEVAVYARGGERHEKGNPVWDTPDVTWGRTFPTPSCLRMNLSDFESWLDAFRPDVVLFNEQREWQPVMMCQDRKIITGCYIDYYTKETVHHFYNYDFLLCNTKRHYSVFDWHPQAFYIPWGVDLDLFKPAADRHDQPYLSPVIFHSAGMAPYRKGTDLLIQAFSRHADIPGSLLIHTQKKLEADFPELRDQLRVLQQAGRLNVVHRTVPAPGLYHMGDLYAYPARLDGLGLTVPEALACGLPVIVPNEAPMNEFVSAGMNGALAEVERYEQRLDRYYWPMNEVSVNALAEKLKEISQPDVLQAMKEQARTYAIQHLNWEKNSGPFLNRLPTVARLDDERRSATRMSALESENLTQYWGDRHPFLYRLSLYVTAKKRKYS